MYDVLRLSILKATTLTVYNNKKFEQISEKIPHSTII